jgi:hypothetical protein
VGNVQAPLNEIAVAELLPGQWSIAATNFPMWLRGERADPLFSYERVSTNPLFFTDDVSYTDVESGKEKHILGTDTFRGDEFVWRGKGWLRFVSSRWSVSGASDDGSIVAIRFSKSRVTPAGNDIIVRAGIVHPELRALIARSTEQFGLTPEEFASLTWLG